MRLDYYVTLEKQLNYNRGYTDKKLDRIINHIKQFQGRYYHKYHSYKTDEAKQYMTVLQTHVKQLRYFQQPIDKDYDLSDVLTEDDYELLGNYFASKGVCGGRMMYFFTLLLERNLPPNHGTLKKVFQTRQKQSYQLPPLKLVTKVDQLSNIHSAIDFLEYYKEKRNNNECIRKFAARYPDIRLCFGGLRKRMLIRSLWCLTKLLVLRNRARERLYNGYDGYIFKNMMIRHELQSIDRTKKCPVA
jgi:hypothetical protein